MRIARTKERLETLSAAAFAIMKKITGRSFRTMDKMLGGILTLFGIIVFLR